MSLQVRVVRWLALVAVCLCVLVPLAVAEPGLGQGCPELVGTWPFGPAVTVATSGDYAFYNSGAGFMVADISDVDAQEVVGTLTVSGVIDKIAVTGHIAYVLSKRRWSGSMGSSRCTGSLHAIDVSDPIDPRQVGSYDLPDDLPGYDCRDPYAEDIAVSGDSVYLVSGDSLSDVTGLHVIDVSQPSAMAEVGFVGIDVGYSHERSVAIADGYAYVTTQYSVSVIDVQDRSEPVLLASVEIPNSKTSGIVVDQGFAYLAAPERPGGDYGRAGGLTVVDVRDPHAPLFVRLIELQQRAQAITVSNGHLYLTESERPHDSHTPFALPGKIRVFELSDPSRPMGVWIVETPDDAMAVAAANSKLCVASNYAGLRVMDLANPRRPVEVASLDTPDGGPFTVSDGYVFMADGPLDSWPVSTLWVADVSEPLHPVLVGSIEIPDAGPVVVSGDHAYVAAGESGLRVIDVSDRSAPVEVGAFSQPWLDDVSDVKVSGDHAFVIGDCNLTVVDVSDPASPSQTDVVFFPECAKAIDVEGDHAYVAASESGLRVVDVSDPASVFEVSCCLGPDEAYRVSTSGGIAYVESYQYSIGGGYWYSTMVDVSDPFFPVPVGSLVVLDLPYGVYDGQVLALSDGYAYVTPLDYWGGWETFLAVVNVHDPSSCDVVGRQGFQGYPIDGEFSDDMFYVADSGAGLNIFDVNGCQTVAQDDRMPLATE